MIRRLYVHNFRCLENFELKLAGQSSVLLIGKNGSGKTTVGLVLEIFQRIARGTNRVDELVKAKDFARGRTDVPMRFEIELEFGSQIYAYSVALELPKGAKELRVAEEKIHVGGQPFYTRAIGLLHWPQASTLAEAANAPKIEFPIDTRLLALPLIQGQLNNDTISPLRQWLARMLVLRPVPGMISGDSGEETLEPDSSVLDLGAWLSGLLSYAPSGYAEIERFLKGVMPDFQDIKKSISVKDPGTWAVRFSGDQGTASFALDDLSDGEKCYIICALVLAANKAYDSVFCFWDEPDNYLALSEVGQFVMAMRAAFEARGQLIATSHNPEVISRFSDENTLYFHRNNHFEPTRVRPLAEVQVHGDLVGALIRDDIEP